VVRGAGTLLNMATVLVGSGLGVLLGGRLPERTRTTVTDALGLVTLVIGALNIAALGDPELRAAVGDGGRLLVVLGALLLGGITGSLLHLEARLESVGQLAAAPADRRRRRRGAGALRRGYVTASLVFVVGPLAVLGSLSDGLGRGIEALVLKSTLDGFAALAFAASLGWGVAASACRSAWCRAASRCSGRCSAGCCRPALVSSITATGGVLLLGVGLRLLALKLVAVGDLLPALVAAPLLVLLADAVR
jgi:uncharacterized membrane protein YqgA involved in biofilm formation